MKRTLSGLLGLIAFLMTLWFVSFAISFLPSADWFIGLGLTALGVLSGTAAFRLGRFALRGRPDDAPGWLTLVVALLVVFVPIGFAVALKDTYRTGRPLRQATSDMKSGLTNLLYAQDEYFAAHGVFAADLAALDTTRNSLRVDQVSLRITSADSTRWKGRAEHERVTSTCTIVAGAIMSGAESAQPVCVDGKVR